VPARRPDDRLSRPQPPCPLCERPLIHPTDHHLVPRSRGGRSEHTVRICRDCHGAIHALLTNRELERDHRTIEALRGEPRLARAIAFIARQPPERRIRHRTAAGRRERTGR
jgi:5-methylcytosine-specific restriction endonuclease McrA